MLQSGHGMRDGRTDRRTDGRSETSIPPNNVIKKNKKKHDQYSTKTERYLLGIKMLTKMQLLPIAMR